MYTAFASVYDRLMADVDYLAWARFYHELMERYGVRRCYYGHLHGGSHRLAIEGKYGKVEYHLVSADYLGFQPQTICE